MPRFVIPFLPKSKCLLTSWMQSSSAVVLKPMKIKSVNVSIVSSSICHKVMGLDRLPGGTTGKEPANAGDISDMGSTPGSGRSPEGGHANPLQYSC